MKKENRALTDPRSGRSINQKENFLAQIPTLAPEKEVP